jgi:hypothetical protein
MSWFAPRTKRIVNVVVRSANQSDHLGERDHWSRLYRK